MISTAEGTSNFSELGIQRCSGEIHGNLAGHGKGLDACLGAQALYGNVPGMSNCLLDGSYG